MKILLNQITELNGGATATLPGTTSDEIPKNADEALKMMRVAELELEQARKINDVVAIIKAREKRAKLYAYYQEFGRHSMPQLTDQQRSEAHALAFHQTTHESYERMNRNIEMSRKLAELKPGAAVFGGAQKDAIAT